MDKKDPSQILLDFINSNINYLYPVCKPLSTYNVTYFSYAKIIYNEDNVKGFGINNNLEWAIHYCNNHCERNHLYYQKINIARQSANKIFYSFNSSLPLSKKFGFKNVFNIFYNHDKYIEKHSFANFDSNNDLTDFYLNNLPLLHRFIYYFKSKTSNLIMDAFNNNVFFNANINSSKKDIYGSSRSNINTGFLKHTECDKILINNSDSNIYLTKKELECLHFVAKGCSMKEIARMLGISSRTVEDHLNNIKIRTGLNYKNQLINLFYDNFCLSSVNLLTYKDY
jgi:DNA-binding CsgD family transcriptional regulator